MRLFISKKDNIMVICSSCGEAVDKNSRFCSSCGARLNGKEKIHSEKSGKMHNNSSAGKSIPVTKIIYIVIALAVVGLVLLFASGILDSGHPAAQQQAGADQTAPSKLESIQAINQQEELVKNTPGNDENLLTLAHMYNDGGFYQKAIDKYKVYLKSNPKAADVIVDMGVCYFNLGKNQEAIDNFKKGIEINPKHQIAHLNMGVVYNSGMNNKTEALKWWKKAVELDPSSDIGKRAQDFLNQNK